MNGRANRPVKNRCRNIFERMKETQRPKRFGLFAVIEISTGLQKVFYV